MRRSVYAGQTTQKVTPVGQNTLRALADVWARFSFVREGIARFCVGMPHRDLSIVLVAVLARHSHNVFLHS